MLRMATLPAAQVVSLSSSLSSFLPLACKSLPVLTLDYVWARPLQVQPTGSPAIPGRLWEMPRVISCLQSWG